MTNFLSMQLACMLQGNKILLTHFGASCLIYHPCFGETKDLKGGRSGSTGLNTQMDQIFPKDSCKSLL